MIKLTEELHIVNETPFAMVSRNNELKINIFNPIFGIQIGVT
jgi:hypothetical protein